MPLHQTGALLIPDFVLGAPSGWRVILLNATGGLTQDSTIASLLRYECIQASGGYAPAAFSYTNGSATYDTVNLRAQVPFFDAQFTGVGSTYTFTHWAMIYGRGANANRVITAINTTTNVLTSVGHGLTDGDRVCITGTTTQPGGVSATTVYFANSLTADTFEIHTNVGLTSIVDITSAGTGTIHLRYANGAIGPYVAQSGTVDPGQTVTVRINNFF